LKSGAKIIITKGFTMDKKRLNQLLAFKAESPDDAFITYALAMEYKKFGEINDTIVLFTSLINEHPNYIGTYYHFAKLLDELDRSEEAEATFVKGLSIIKEVGDQHAYEELSGAYELFKLKNR